ncbi:MAG TPA: hypothetical protein VFF69_10500 [Phycisphaerales bacterium]|nr:hypothetical protein [Phycisphaerales bacterium]
MRTPSRFATASIALLAAAGAGLMLGAGDSAQPACTVTTDDICDGAVTLPKISPNARPAWSRSGADILYNRPGGDVAIGHAVPPVARLDVRADDTAIYARARNDAPAIFAEGAGGDGIFAATSSGDVNRAAIRGLARPNEGFHIGVWGETRSPGGIGAYGRAPGGAWGLVTNADLSVAGNKSFRIDHPLDPGNKYLLHYCTEGAEPMLTYSGNAVLDSRGRAVIALPAYVAAIGADFRYDLTPIGSPAPDLHVASEFDGAAFAIAGGRPGQKVSWELSARRNDRYVQKHGAPVETAKPAIFRGRYINPDLYGLGAELDEAALYDSPALQQSEQGLHPTSGSR